MRQFLVIFIAAWLTGITLNIWQTSWWWLIILTTFFILLGPRFIRVPFIVAAGSIGVAAFIFAQGFEDTNHLCVKPSSDVVTIKQRMRVTEFQARYMVEDGAGCRIAVTANRFPLFYPGDTVIIQSSFQPVAQVAQKSPEYAAYLKQHRIQLVAPRAELTLHTSQRGILTGIHEHMRQTIFHIFPEPGAGFVLALFLDERGGIPAQLEEAIRVVGLSHIVAISGFHISLIAGFLWMITLGLPVSQWWRSVMIIIIVWLYVWLVGLPASAVRAAWFWTLLLLLRQRRLLLSLPTIIILTLLVMMTYQPQIIQDVSFQLSLSAVLGIGGLLFITKRIRFHRSSIGQWLQLSFFTTLGATVATAPIIVWHFGSISTLSLVANMVVLPVVPVMMVTAALSIIVGLIFLPLALATALIFHACFWWMGWVAQFLSRLPFASMNDISVTPSLVIAYYAAIMGGMVLCIWYQGRSWREVWE